MCVGRARLLTRACLLSADDERKIRDYTEGFLFIKICAAIVGRPDEYVAAVIRAVINLRPFIHTLFRSRGLIFF